MIWIFFSVNLFWEQRSFFYGTSNFIVILIVKVIYNDCKKNMELLKCDQCKWNCILNLIFFKKKHQKEQICFDSWEKSKELNFFFHLNVSISWEINKLQTIQSYLSHRQSEVV